LVLIVEFFLTDGGMPINGLRAFVGNKYI